MCGAGVRKWKVIEAEIYTNGRSYEREARIEKIGFPKRMRRGAAIRAVNQVKINNRNKK